MLDYLPLFSDHTHHGRSGTHFDDRFMPQPAERCCRNPRRGCDGAELLLGGRQISSEKVRFIFYLCKSEKPKQMVFLNNLVFLVLSKSYVWSSLGVTALAFLTGALAFWLPNFLSRARVYQKLSDKPGDSSDRYSMTSTPRRLLAPA